MEIIVDRKTLSEVFNIAEKYVNELQFPKEDYNKYDLRKCIPHFLAHKEKIHQKEIEKIKSDKPQDDLARKNARLKELEIQERENKLISTDIVRLAWLNETAIYGQLMDALSARTAPIIAGRNDVRSIKKIIDAEVNRIKEKIAELPIDLSGEFTADNLYGSAAAEAETETSAE